MNKIRTDKFQMNRAKHIKPFLSIAGQLLLAICSATISCAIHPKVEPCRGNSNYIREIAYNSATERAGFAKKGRLTTS